MHEYGDGSLALLHGPRETAAHTPDGAPLGGDADAPPNARKSAAQARSMAKPVDGVDKLRLPTPPTGTAKSEAYI